MTAELLHHHRARWQRWGALGLAFLSVSMMRIQSGGSPQEPCRIATTLSRLPGLAEASGIAVSRRAPGMLWAVVDSGAPILYAIEPARGAVVGRVQVAGAAVQDWEDVSVGVCPRGTCVYIADIGDNRATRDHVTVYRVAEPDARAQTTEPADAFHATYPDGPQDAEAFFVTPQRQLFVVTKGDTGPITLYRFPDDVQPGSRVRLERVSALPLAKSRGAENPRITDAETSPDGRWVALRTHDAVIFYGTSDILAGSIRERFRADVRPLREPQGEGVAIGAGGDIYLVGENGGVGTFARLTCRFPQ